MLNKLIKKVLIIGHGSIGIKHKIALQELDENISFFTYNSNNKPSKYLIKSIDPDYIIISTPTSKHYENLNLIDNLLKKKIILVEKPIFEKFKFFKKNTINKNKIVVGYNLRFHPVIQYLKKKVKNKNFYFLKSMCHSYLPQWRKKNYKKSYSSNAKLGGGASLDLSHEIDYIQWIFGNINFLFKKKFKISKLKIKSEDMFLSIGKIHKKILCNISLSYASRNNIRQLLIDGNSQSIYADLNLGLLKITKKKTKTIKFKYFSHQNTLKFMHKSILKGKFSDCCTVQEALKVLKTIN